ncbi:hypothetical protein HOK40_03485, partial [Candidatus Peregrinibacteria bacterium]|nr:hypothetical protein [Candidatus Peregrinibacteria bacterium]
AGIVWSTISKEDLAEMEATAKETSGILDELISTIPDADIHVLFTELEDGSGFKASARSSAAVDVSLLAGQLFGGGGHSRAAGFRVAGFDNFQLAVLDAVQKLKEGMHQQKESAASGPVDVQARIPSAVSPEASAPKPQKPKPKTTPKKSTDIVDEIANTESKDSPQGTDIIKGLDR